MKNTKNPNYSDSYCLKLCDGTGWTISAEPSLSPWLRRFASILQLNQGQGDSGFHRLHYMNSYDKNRGDDMANLRHIRPDIQELSVSNVSYEHKASRVWYDHGSRDAICEVDNDADDDAEVVNMWYSTQPIFQRTNGKGGLAFHAGLGEWKGQGILFAGHGNAGKSTTCRRLPPHWSALCDDEVLAVRDGEKNYKVHPFPTWSDHLWRNLNNTWDVQYSVPLSAIFFICQSETDEVEPLGEGQAAALINEASIQTCRKFWARSDKMLQRKFRQEIFQNACEMAKKIPAYRLYITLHGRFWEKVEECLSV
jgi:SynChlorMet cassette protein ScmC